MFPVVIIFYVVVVVVLGSSPHRCQDTSWTMIADAEFRENVRTLHQELYNPQRKPERPQFDSILAHQKLQIENEYLHDIDFDGLNAIISDIGKLQSELQRLSQEIKLLDDYEDEGGIIAYLQKVRAESQKVDEKFLSRVRYMNRPLPEKVEELNQIYSRNQMTIKDNDKTLASKGLTQYELQLLRDPETEDIDATDLFGAATSTRSDSGSDKKSVRRRPLSWHVSQPQIDSDDEKRNEESQKESEPKPSQSPSEPKPSQLPSDKWKEEHRWAEWLGGVASPASAKDVKIVPPRSLHSSLAAEAAKPQS